MNKFATVVTCLIAAVVFGAVGMWAAWVVGSTANGAWKARDWVKVRAELAWTNALPFSERRATYRADAAYRYTYAGVDYTGRRLGIATAFGADDIGDWEEDMAEFLRSATEEKRPIMVYVNDANPAEAVIDRSMRMPLVWLLGPFALGYGGVALGALVAAGYFATRQGEANVNAQDPHSGNGALWALALAWNAVTLPVAIVVVYYAWRTANLPAFLVLILPVVGLFFVWAALSATWKAMRASGNVRA